MQKRALTSLKLRNVRQFSVSNDAPLGFVGLGHMGGKMVENLSKDGRKVLVFDANSDAIQKVVDASAAGNKSVSKASLDEISQKCSVIFSMLPNDQVRCIRLSSSNIRPDYSFYTLLAGGQQYH